LLGEIDPVRWKRTHRSFCS